MSGTVPQGVAPPSPPMPCAPPLLGSPAEPLELDSPAEPLLSAPSPPAPPSTDEAPAWLPSPPLAGCVGRSSSVRRFPPQFTERIAAMQNVHLEFIVSPQGENAPKRPPTPPFRRGTGIRSMTSM